MASQPHVLILGGGPAGAATALALRRHTSGCAVSVAEAGDYSGLRVGETLHPAARALLQRLRVWESFLSEGHAKAYGSVAAWGSDQPGANDFFTWRLGSGYHLDRRRFDAWLADAAENQGTRLWRQTRLLDAARYEGRWRARVEGPDGAFDTEADFIVDATGRRAAFARRQGVRPVLYDRLVGAYRFFEGDGSADSRAWIEATADGWWYAARLPEGRFAIACMTDSDLARQQGLAQPEAWLSALARTRHIQNWLPRYAAKEKPQLFPAQSGRLDACAGEGWLAVGDAAAHFDPLSGQGLTQVLRGAVAVAYAIADTLAGKTDSLERYQAFITAEMNGFLSAQAHFYGQERRWPEQEFWKRRNGNLTLPPDLPLQAARQAEPPTSAVRDFLSRSQWQSLLAFCQTPRPAHAIVARMEQATGLPARHLINALQQALETGRLISPSLRERIGLADQEPPFLVSANIVSPLITTSQ